MAALQREIKFYVMHPDDPKLTVRSSYNVKNPYAPDRYYQGWGNMRDMRHMWAINQTISINYLQKLIGILILIIVMRFVRFLYNETYYVMLHILTTLLIKIIKFCLRRIILMTNAYVI